MRGKGATGGLVLVILFIVCTAWAVPPPERFVLVVNVANELPSISRKDAERIFLNKKRIWPDGVNVAVVINRNQKIYDSFCAVILRRSSHQFMIFQKKMLFRGQGMPPPMVKNDEDVIEYVASHPGGLGYVSPDAVTPAVKILSLVQ